MSEMALRPQGTVDPISSPPPAKGRPRRHRPWHNWSLAQQFVVCATLVLVPMMLLSGQWITHLIRDGVLRHASAAAALYMENFVEPIVQDLARQDTLTPEGEARFDRLLADTSLGQEVVAFKVWLSQGRVAYSSRPGLAGRTFPVTPRLAAAWRGDVSAQLDDLDEIENLTERQFGISLFELYVPVRERGTERVIAVVEFYQRADLLERELVDATWKAWAIVGTATFAMLSILFLIVWRGSNVIESQQDTLKARVADLTQLLTENGALRRRVETASARATETNEFYLRRLGADLHDGPAQLISLALLRLDEVTPSDPAGRTNLHDGQVDAVPVDDVLRRALKELRDIAEGFAVPEIENLSISEAIRAAIRRHEQLSAKAVAVTIVDLPAQVSPAVTLCAYRVVQEGLSNASRHAHGLGQAVNASFADGAIRIEVSDKGPGLEPTAVDGGGLGLRGLADRVISIGGSFEVIGEPGRGTWLRATLPVHAGSER